MKHSRFLHLHVHSEFSILDSTLRIEKLVKKAEEFKLPALAITDNSNLFGAISFYEACKSSGIKPIIGAEVYVAPKSLSDKTPTGLRNESYELVLLVKNDKGYKNLNQLLTIAQFDGFYYRPRVDKKLLKQYKDGLIALSGSFNAEIGSLILAGKKEEAKKVILDYQDIFGIENFYVEIMNHGLKSEKLVNDELISLSKEMNFPLVATNDCHYLERGDSFAHEIARCIYSGLTLNERSTNLSGTEYYFKSPSEMEELFKDCQEALTNTLTIAEHCNFDFDLNTHHMPEFNVPKNLSREEFLKELCEKGMEGRVDKNSDIVQKRLNHELKIIKEMGFISYFLIVWDFVNYAKKNRIPVGPGRGSAAGSLVAYLLSITDVDPLKYGLLFERFLNPARVSMPDIDIDFCYDRRSEVIDYVSDFYGKRSVAQIITFGTLAARAVIRDVGRVMGIPYSKVDLIAKMIPGEPKMTLNKAMEMEPKIQELMKQDNEVEALFNYSLKLEGLPRNTSTHAAGIIISKGELTEKVPLYKGQNNEVITQFDGPSSEKIGLLKMDFLGLRTLTVIENTIKLINKGKKNPILQDLREIPIDDISTYELLNKGNTLGVFQLESSGMRDLMKRLGVKQFSDIVALVALYRPGPMQMADEFIQRKHGKMKVEYLHPSLEKILKETHGIMLYQEQVMQCAQELAGFSLAEADNLRRIMGKKKEEAMRKLRDKFVEGAVANKVDRGIAEKVFEQMEYFAGYGFNKSHSVAYGLVAYHTAWFKANYPKEFMASLLSSEKNNTDKIAFYIDELKNMGIECLPPSISHSFDDFTVEGEGIRYGLSAIKNVGSSAVSSVIKKREEEGHFKSIADFAKRVDNKTLNKKTLESLIKAGAFDTIEQNRRYLFEIIEDITKFAAGMHRDNMHGQESFLNILDSTSKQSISSKNKKDYPNWQEHDLLKYEKELLGVYVSGHPLGEYSKLLKRFSSSSTESLLKLKDGDDIKIGGVISSLKLTKTVKTGDSMAIFQLEDLKGTVECVVYPRTFKIYENFLKVDEPVFIHGVIQSKNNISSIAVNEICELKRVQETLTTKIIIRIDETENDKIVSDLKNILEKYPGGTNVFIDIHLSSGKKLLIKSSGKYAISPCEEAISEIEKLLGEDCVWLHIKDKEKQSFQTKKKI